MTIRKLISAVIITALFPLVAFSQKDKKSTVKDTREYVDLGLPSGTLWATCNIGASKPEEFGLYFAWGETQGYTSDASDEHQFIKENNKWWDCDCTVPVLLKYCISWSGIADYKKVLDPEDDAATVNWGRKWQMPSSEQIKELCDSTYTTAEWTTLNGVNGRKITSKKNGNSIFLPATFFTRFPKSTPIHSPEGAYWSRTLYTDDSDAVSLYFFKNVSFFDSHNPRYHGLSIRPVRTQKQKSGKKKIDKNETEEDIFMVTPVEVPLPE